MLACVRTCHNAEQVYSSIAAQSHREGQQHPGQIGRGEIENPQEAQIDIWMPPPPHIHLAGKIQSMCEDLLIARRLLIAPN